MPPAGRSGHKVPAQPLLAAGADATNDAPPPRGDASRDALELEEERELVALVLVTCEGGEPTGLTLPELLLGVERPVKVLRILASDKLSEAMGCASTLIPPDVLMLAPASLAEERPLSEDDRRESEADSS